MAGWVKPVAIGGAAALGAWLLLRQRSPYSQTGPGTSATGQKGLLDFLGFGEQGYPQTSPRYSAQQGTVQDISELLSGGTKLLDSIGGFFRPGPSSNTSPASGTGTTDWFTDFKLTNPWA